MNALTATITETETAELSRVGEIAAVWQVSPTDLMLMGWQSDRIAPQGSTIFPQERSKRQGRFRAISWPADETGSAHGFLVAVRFPEPSPCCGNSLLLTSPDSTANLIGRLPPSFDEPQRFATELARAARGGAGAALVARFLSDAFLKGGSRTPDTISGMIAA